MRVIVIPARMASRRLPGKPLVDVCGETLLSRTVSAARAATVCDEVIVTSCDAEIAEESRRLCVRFVETPPDSLTGTHRIAAAIDALRGLCIERVVNLQVDEPCVCSSDLNAMLRARSFAIETLTCAMQAEDWDDPDVVKVAMSSKFSCHWFSRAPLAGARRHVGVYSFAPTTLRQVGRLRETALSKAESLEQLAWIEAGHRVSAMCAYSRPISVNCEQDLKHVRAYFESCACTTAQ